MKEIGLMSKTCTGAVRGVPAPGFSFAVPTGITCEPILRIACRAIRFVCFSPIMAPVITSVPALSTTLLPEIYQ
jgi:hypothetical protein